MSSSTKFRPKTTANIGNVRNFVKEGASVKVNKQASKKQYTPGIYTRHQ